MSHLSGPPIVDYRNRDSGEYNTMSSGISPSYINPNPINQGGYPPQMQGGFQTPNPYWKHEELRGSQAERQARFE